MKERDRRNLNATAPAYVAMALYNKRYAAQNGGSMDFWDKLSAYEKRTLASNRACTTGAQTVARNATAAMRCWKFSEPNGERSGNPILNRRRRLERDLG